MQRRKGTKMKTTTMTKKAKDNESPEAVQRLYLLGVTGKDNV